MNHECEGQIDGWTDIRHTDSKCYNQLRCAAKNAQENKIHTIFSKL